MSLTAAHCDDSTPRILIVSSEELVEEAADAVLSVGYSVAGVTSNVWAALDTIALINVDAVLGNNHVPGYLHLANSLMERRIPFALIGESRVPGASCSH